MRQGGSKRLTIGLADSYGPKVRVNGILPGAVLTDITNVWTDEQRVAAAAITSLKRVGIAEDFAGTALWLASGASAWVSGTLVRVDGGAYRQTS